LAKVAKKLLPTELPAKATLMLLDPQKISAREKLILTGLYLSKYDVVGLRKLGFDSFVEAFNVIAYALA
jgi:hypothetical protein